MPWSCAKRDRVPFPLRPSSAKKSTPLYFFCQDVPFCFGDGLVVGHAGPSDSPPATRPQLGYTRMERFKRQVPDGLVERQAERGVLLNTSQPSIRRGRFKLRLSECPLWFGDGLVVGSAAG